MVSALFEESGEIAAVDLGLFGKRAARSSRAQRGCRVADRINKLQQRPTG